MGLLLIIALLGGAYLLYKNNGQLPGAVRIGNSRTPIDIINERYAAGEIDRAEYERLRRDLG